MYIKRTLEGYIAGASRQFPVRLITGPRQVGKTSLLRHLAGKGRTYVTLDDPVSAALAREEPRLFLERFKPPVLIDEIQYAPQLLPYIKMDVDHDKQPGKYWLTGSQQFHLMRGVSESLAGRVGILNLLGLSQLERQNLAKVATPFVPTREESEKRLKKATVLDLRDIYRAIWRGSFPAIALDKKMDRDLFYSSYVQTYLQRDLAQVGDGLAFLKFLRAAAARTGQLLNLSEMARDCDVSPPTAKSWLSILQASGIVYLLEPYHSNLTKRLIKTPKLYFLDTGLCSYLTAWSSPETLEAGAMSGAIFETYVVAEILKSWWHNGKQAPLHYYRDKDKKEIDLLVIVDQTIHPVEIKKTSIPSKDAVRHFSVLDHLKKNIGTGALICMSGDVIPVKDNIQAIPASII
ncbi:MAG: ATP-binding protein [Gammaproteobacteria bacterium]|nr:ATP-binding protein [Gammaproteobacteria bacterium]